uniref:Uncharacterized protein n=1 Tax=Mucochytrium quahogii TaxID=96639 RepID=A0A7S2RIB1_9STRA|mmetsp:Transcript_4109/g.6056  ORF Transcript_4109/g.6056 Transcript_4109/m.6056 type:complete len:269 (-) Transcript_4109:7-813(-)|eukprot:CAMPEP_0203751116 /NCGR_PEP_ID=MMETSP0098-20131031/5237_1 /ASSEMBLY_ACC=CAM_ASM_000208 /TAXON_ID=96639 /ORGANISM=" , Strain NY0313808BC1" /LENGTH=268 /DNA_ID=CAMNT_0050640691 /DNA_START=257 /DNA_END=1063 /DNA_ORIENTATION=+
MRPGHVDERIYTRDEFQHGEAGNASRPIVKESISRADSSLFIGRQELSPRSPESHGVIAKTMEYVQSPPREAAGGPLPSGHFPEYTLKPGKRQTPRADQSSDISNQDARWFLSSFEQYNLGNITGEEAKIIQETGLRAKSKHRNAVLFQDDYNFIFKTQASLELPGVEAGRIDKKSKTKLDKRKFLIHKAIDVVKVAYKLSIEHAPPKSCIWSAMMNRVAFHMQRSGYPQVTVSPSEKGVEELLIFDEFRWTRSNFSKLFKARQSNNP